MSESRIEIVKTQVRRRWPAQGSFRGVRSVIGATLLLALGCGAAHAAGVEVPGKGEVTIYRDD